MRPVSRADIRQFALAAVLVAAAAAAHYLDVTAVLAFAVAAAAIAFLAHLVGGATEQLGGRVGSSAAGVVQSALGNLPELFIALFALHHGLVGVVQAALVGSVIANGVLVLGLAFLVGGIRNGPQRFESSRARMIATLAMLAVGRSSRCRRSRTRSTRRRRSTGARSSLICAGVLIVLFFATLPSFLRGGDGARRRAAALVARPDGRRARRRRASAAAFASDWFVSALKPATHAMHMSQDFAGLVVVAIAGNAVENVVGVQLAARNRPDFAVSVIVNSALQVALLLTPVLVFASLGFADLADARLPDAARDLAAARRAGIGALVVYDGESTWEEGRDPRRALRRARSELLVGRVNRTAAITGAAGTRAA